MKAATALLLMAPLWAQLPVKSAAVVTSTAKPTTMRETLTQLEKRMDNKISMADGADPFNILGLTRGLYLEGYGAVFTTELDLVQTPVPTPFQQVIPKQQAIKIHQRKLDHLPLLEKTLREMWQDAAAALISTPDTDQIVIAVRLLYQPSWEDTKGLPAQILLKGTRKGSPEIHVDDK